MTLSFSSWVVFFLFFLVSFELSWDLCFKGSFHWGADQAEAGSHEGSLCQYASVTLSVHRGPLVLTSLPEEANVSLRKSNYFCRDLLLIISFQKNIKVLLVSGSLFLKKNNSSSSMAKTVLVLQRPWTTVTYKFVS